MKRGRRLDRQLLARIGRPALWERALLCPCQQEEGRRDYACLSCDGRGYIYSSPHPIEVLLTSDRRDLEFDMAGAWERGECTATLSAHLAVGEQDRIVPLDAPVRYNMLVERTQALEDPLRVPEVLQLELAQDRRRAYRQEEDYVLAQNGDVFVVRWLSGGNRPVSGEAYSLVLWIRPLWVVMEAPMIRAFGRGKKNQLPLRLRLQRFDKAILGR